MGHPPDFTAKPGGLLEQALQHDSASLSDEHCGPIDDQQDLPCCLRLGSDDVVNRCEEQRSKEVPSSVDDDSMDECTWDAFAFHMLFEDEYDRFPDPNFLIFEIMACR